MGKTAPGLGLKVQALLWLEAWGQNGAKMAQVSEAGDGHPFHAAFTSSWDEISNHAQAPLGREP